MINNFVLIKLINTKRIIPDSVYKANIYTAVQQCELPPLLWPQRCKFVCSDKTLSVVM